MGCIVFCICLLVEFAPAHPSAEVTIENSGVHDGIWDALRTPEGSFICCGYMGSSAWLGKLSPDMGIEWQLLLGSGSSNEEALALCPFLDNYAVAVNSGVFSPGARHQLQDSSGWIMLISKDGETLDTLSCSLDYRRVITDIAPGPGNYLACCGIIYGSNQEGSGAFWLMDSLGTIAVSVDLGADSLISIDCIEPVPGGDYILGGTSSVSPSFTMVRVDPAGNIQWMTRAGPGLLWMHARDILITDEGSCIAAGGGEWDNPVAVELDMDTGRIIRTITDDLWLTLFDCERVDGVLMMMGHNMLCDGADSETMIIGCNTDDPLLPLTVTCSGACRCRTLISSGDEFFIFGEVSEFWDGHQDIWAAATSRTDWIPTEFGSRLNADYE
jgi:hypothetical protein